MCSAVSAASRSRAGPCRNWEKYWDQDAQRTLGKDTAHKTIKFFFPLPVIPMHISLTPRLAGKTAVPENGIRKILDQVRCLNSHGAL
jgi:hypothetical protein